MSGPIAVLVTCEHAGRRVPERHQSLFEDRPHLLDTHRAWDPGALAIARALSVRLEAPLFTVRVTRLLVDTNRSPGNPRMWSELSRRLPRHERDRLLRQVHQPHWRRVQRWIAERVEAGRRVVHIGSHTFTPILDEVERRCDVGVLFDPSRGFEREIAGRLVDELRARLPDLGIRRNAPYRGIDDGLTRGMRRRFAAVDYAGIELEVSQRFVRGPRRAWRRVRDDVVEALGAALGHSA
ncbi:MAG TPA: N-formylglutamate amidohydrolase [Thermoanaerobaculia bacterium]|nr:N-formylglutamate amidohydrolase [Thermoanaerobaculia bacterium]